MRSWDTREQHINLRNLQKKIMSEDHMDEFEHYNFDQDKHVNLSGHSGMYVNTWTHIKDIKIERTEELQENPTLQQHFVCVGGKKSSERLIPL